MSATTIITINPVPKTIREVFGSSKLKAEYDIQVAGRTEKWSMLAYVNRDESGNLRSVDFPDYPGCIFPECSYSESRSIPWEIFQSVASAATDWCRKNLILSEHRSIEIYVD